MVSGRLRLVKTQQADLAIFTKKGLMILVLIKSWYLVILNWQDMIRFAISIPCTLGREKSTIEALTV